MALINQGIGVYVQYVGPRRSAQLVLRKKSVINRGYKFGNNPHDRINAVHNDDVEKLQALSSRDYLVLSVEDIQKKPELNRHIKIDTQVGIERDIKELLIGAGYETLGQILADDPDNIVQETTLEEDEVLSLVEDIAQHFDMWR